MNEETKNFLISLGVLACILLAILAWTYWQNATERRSYNNFPFKKQGQLWVTSAEHNGQPYTIPFYYHPSELQDIAVTEGVEQPILRAGLEGRNATVFVTLSPELKSKAVVAAVEISRITGSRYKILNLTTHGALTSKPDNPDASTQRPIVTCDQARYNNTFVIHLRKGSNNVVTSTDNGCIILEGETAEDLKRVADRFAYMLLGIME